MTYFEWVLLSIFFISLITIVVLLVRKVPQLIVIDLATIAKEREARVRERLLRSRIERRFARVFHWRPLHTLTHTMDLWAHRLENGDVHAGVPGHVVRTRTLDDLRQLVAAREKERSHGFLAEGGDGTHEAPVRTASDQEFAALHVELGGALLRAGAHGEALEHFEDAAGLIPNNPKYLDALLSAAILVGNRERAGEVFAQLVQVNPENEKIPEFKKKVAALIPPKHGKKKNEHVPL